MSTLGSLSVELSANIVRFTEAMDRASAIAEKNMQSIERSVSRTAGRIGGLLAGALAVGALVNSAKQAIDFADAMGDAAERAGMGVEKFSALAYAAKQSDVSMDTLETTTKKLSVAMVQAAGGNEKFSKLFDALGVNVTDANGKLRGTEAVLRDVATKFANAADGPTKVAYAMELLGKTGEQAIPLLNKGGAEIMKLEEEARALGKTVSQDTAEAADKFNKNVEKLTNNSGELARRLTTTLIPSLNDVVTAMIQARKESGAFGAVVAGLGGIGNIIFGDGLSTDAEKLDKVTEKIRQMNVVVETLRSRGNSDSAIAPELKQLQDAIALRDQLTAKMAADSQRRQAAAASAESKPQLPPIKTDAKAVGDLLKYTNALQDLQDKILGKAGGLDSGFNKDVTMLNTAFASGILSAEDYASLFGKLIEQQPFYVKGLKDIEDNQRHVNDMTKEARVAELELINARDDMLNSLEDGNASLKTEIATLGMTTLAREKYILSLQKQHDLSLALDDDDVTRINNLYAQRDALLDAKAAMEEQLGFWGLLSDGAANFAATILDGPGAALKYLRNLAKQLLADLISMFAKKWVLQLGGSLIGGTAGEALATQAGNLSGNSLLTSGLSALGNTSIGSGVSSYLFGTAGVDIAGGEIAAASAGALGSGGMMASLAALGPYAAIAIALFAAYQAFKDKGENWQGQIGFGANANAYTTQGVFGPEGFNHIAGNDELNKQLQAFMASFRKLDETLAASLSPEAMLRIQATLAGYGATRTSQGGGPGTFAFGKGDDTAGAQLTLEYLQTKYSTIFDEIDTKFADFIRTYTGTAENLATEIGAFARVLAEISVSPIAGLNIDILRSWQAEGETLAQTLQRVNAGYMQYYDLFYTEEEKKLKLQEQLNAAFKQMNLVVPASMEAFRKLVDSIDLSTEAGRTMYQFLMQMAPAFAALHPALDATVEAVQTLTYSAEELARITGQADFDEMLRRRALGQQQDQARAGLGGYLGGLLTNAESSPLSPFERLSQARSSYETMLAGAQGGDLASIQGLSGSADVYLRIARELFASGSGYIDIFRGVYDQLAGVAGAPNLNQTIANAMPKQGQIASQSDVQQLWASSEAVRVLLIEIRDNATGAAKSLPYDLNSVAISAERR